MFNDKKSNSLRILVELDDFDKRKGAVRDILDLIEFSKNKDLTFILTGKISPQFRKEFIQLPIKIISGRSLQYSRLMIVPYLFSVLKWIIKLNKIKPHIVHINYTSWGPSLAAAAHFLKIPIVGRSVTTYKKENLSSQWFDAYVANCREHAKALLNSPLKDKVYITGSILTVTDLSTDNLNLTEPLPSKPDNSCRFLFLGQLIERKGIDILLNAFAKIQHPADLLLVGGNWTESGFPQKMKQLHQKLQLSDKVHFIDHRTDVNALLQHSDVFVLPSRYDTRPRTIIEAMFSGKPVISTSSGGIPELIEDGITGTLVTPGDIDSLANAMDLLAQSPELRKNLGLAAKKWANENLTPENAVNNYFNLYHKLAE